MDKAISPGASIRQSSFLPAIKDKENKHPDSTITMGRSKRCVNTYHVDRGKVYFPFYKLKLRTLLKISHYWWHEK
ncbi:hypothetical protein [Endozoicomonas sp. SCSIO W0465]|uniref:hypothetical protein n=1 Tax=Endozoicomonas sp. SCSIO W0465 TaxID=2918516 RepID=UPI002075244B|nr:hypothetical protein [Endozoicomonas sp. SCSIO W0465]USE38771.1 hypothetical protein MJO57_11705 [Endozoicomonas sp. SCSIO W0465]